MVSGFPASRVREQGPVSVREPQVLRAKKPLALQKESPSWELLAQEEQVLACLRQERQVQVSVLPGQEWACQRRVPPGRPSLGPLALPEQARPALGAALAAGDLPKEPWDPSRKAR